MLFSSNRSELAKDPGMDSDAVVGAMLRLSMASNGGALSQAYLGTRCCEPRSVSPLPQCLYCDRKANMPRQLYSSV